MNLAVPSDLSLPPGVNKRHLGPFLCTSPDIHVIQASSTTMYASSTTIYASSSTRTPNYGTPRYFNLPSQTVFIKWAFRLTKEI